MFGNLTNFEHKRNIKEALGFYIAYLILNIVVGAVLGVLFGHGTSFNAGYSSGLVVGEYAAIVIQIVVGLLVLIKRKRYKNIFYIILFLLAIFLTKFGGALVGLIPLAYLTTV